MEWQREGAGRFPGLCDWWVVKWKQFGSDCDLVEGLSKDVSGGTRKGMGKFETTEEPSLFKSTVLLIHQPGWSAESFAYMLELLMKLFDCYI